MPPSLISCIGESATTSRKSLHFRFFLQIRERLHPYISSNRSRLHRSSGPLTALLIEIYFSGENRIIVMQFPSTKSRVSVNGYAIRLS